MPVKPKLGTVSNATNEMIADAIRNGASMDYRRRVPAATQAGIDAVSRELNNYTPLRNEFLDAFINKVGQSFGRSQVYTNPFKEFKKGLLSWGESVEEYQVGLLKAHSYSPESDYGERALFGRELAEVQTNYHRINREEFYKITIHESILRRAFTTDGGLSQLVSDLMQAPLNSDEYDEFLIMCRLFAQYESMGGFHRVQIPDLSTLSSSEADARQALRVMRSVGETLKFPSTQYNAARMPTFANADDLVLFTTPDARAAMDVDALAGAFNIDRADVPFRMITIRPEDLGIDGAQAILTTTDFFQVYDTVLENRSQPNAAGLYDNYFWHHHGIYSASRFVPSVLFTTGPGDEVITVSDSLTSINSVSVTDLDGNVVTEVERGHWYEVDADITETSEGFANHGITYTLTGNDSNKTVVTARGVLKVGATEKSDELTITATDSNAAVKLAAVAVTVSPDVTGPEHPEWPVDRSEGDPDDPETEGGPENMAMTEYPGDDAKVSELRSYADTHGISLGGVTSKADIVEAIKSAEDSRDDDE